VIAFSGVVMASVYALRLFIGAMHNRVGPKVKSRDITVRDGLVLVPLIAVILFLALYPQFALHRSEGSVKGAVASAHAALKPAPATLAGGLPNGESQTITVGGESGGAQSSAASSAHTGETEYRQEGSAK